MNNKFIINKSMRTYFYFFYENGFNFIYSNKNLKIRSINNYYYGIKLTKNENNRTRTPRFRLL